MLHSQSVFAEEQQGSDAFVSQASPVVAAEATATGDDSQAAASNQAASETETKTEKVLSAFAEGTESTAPTTLSVHDPANAQPLQEQTQKEVERLLLLLMFPLTLSMTPLSLIQT